MTRTKKYRDGTRFEGFKAPVDVSDRLREMPNRSEFIIEAVREKLGIYDDELLNLEIRAIDQEISRFKVKLLDLEAAKAQKEAILRSRQNRRTHALEARVKALEVLQRIPEPNRRIWLQSRIDVLADCDWRSADEALAWLTENAGKVTR